MNKHLPQSLKPYFWSYDFSKIDPEKNRKIIISQVMNYGNLVGWKWLVNNYGWDELRGIILDFRPDEIKKRTLKLASLWFDFNPNNINAHALRSSN